MVAEYLLVGVLIVNLLFGLKISSDFKKYKRLRDEILTIQQDISSYLEEVDAFVENFKKIYSSRSELLKDTMSKASCIKEELEFLVKEAKMVAHKTQEPLLIKHTEYVEQTETPEHDTSLLASKKVDLFRKIQELR